MIKANELRVGNLVKSPINWLNPQGEFMLDDIIFSEVLRNYKTESLLPIPITEEWLVKFGFERAVHSNNFYKDKCPFHIVSFNGKYVFMLRHNEEGILIKTVHRLQNLYFTLTGEELTIR